MTQLVTHHLDQIHVLLAEKGYDVTELSTNVLRIKELESGLTIQGVLSGSIMYFSLSCLTVPAEAISPALMRKMLSATNGISTSYFQLYDLSDGSVTVTLNNFCSLMDLGPEDSDDILACVHYLLADVLVARHMLDSIVSQAKS